MTKNKKKAQNTQGKSKEKQAEKKQAPAYLRRSQHQFIVGTEDYRALIADYNEKFNTSYNTWRVRPAMLYKILQAMREYYKAND
jgi:hypothetical protein